MTAHDFFNKVEYQDSPLAALTEFLDAEERYEIAQEVERMRFVGYVLELGYDTATIITSDPYKVAVGGIPRGSFLILAPNDLKGLPPHFTLIRVMETAQTPLSGQVQQTYFELHKKSMPELDVWTQSELQWGALKCAVLGMFYPNPTNRTRVEFSGDVNSVVSAHRYRVYSPDETLLDMIVNGLVRPVNQRPVSIGNLRPTENQLATILNTSNVAKSVTTVKVSVDDFKGARTAMFGKTRLGKSNVVKLLAQAMITATEADHSVGQLIFDINGEYANDNEQDGSRSIRSANESVCEVYALTRRASTPSKPLRLNFYEQPDSSMIVLRALLKSSGRVAIYIQSFASVDLLSIDEIGASQGRDKVRALRRVQMLWAILSQAGYSADESRLQGLRGKLRASPLDPGFSVDFRKAAYDTDTPPAPPSTLSELTAELHQIWTFYQSHEDDKDVKGRLKWKAKFEADDKAMLGMLFPAAGGRAGTSVLREYRDFHHHLAGDFVKEVLDYLDAGRTVILDLGNAPETIRQYFSDMLSARVFAHQEAKFNINKLGRHFVHLYFEEAHNLFPVGAKDLTGVYSRFAKEGAKFHIGMTYSTQSPSTIYGELLNQTENFFVGHLSSADETRTLARLQRAFVGVEEEIMRSKTPGFMRMLTQSHRFIIPVQARLFEAGDGS